ncbi:MAG: hypothetical protein LUF28_09430 [Clostridiales bacterium]|nr:hypothetical protein [Clostridiales bacterium]
MFSSSELIHFVFANDDDDYYCGGLLRLKLNQYLCMKLHEERYHTVYFLSRSDAHTFSIQTYDNIKSDTLAVKSSWWSRIFGTETEEKQQGDWLRSQLEADTYNKVAFVCPLDDFCRLLEAEEWESTLTSLANLKRRTGIFVLTAPVTAEGSQKLLLHSRVFKQLNETAVTGARNGGVRPLYPSIQEKKRDSMLYLNTFRRDRIQDLLCRLSFDEGRILPRDQLDGAADYLTRYLNCAALRKAQPLFDGGRLTWNFKYRDLYERLQKGEVLERLLLQSRRARQSGFLQQWQEDAPPGILREKGSYAERCLQLTVPETMADAEQCRVILDQIRGAVRTPKNRFENDSIVAEFEDLFTELDTAKSSEDGNTYRRALYAILFCVQWVYVDKGQEEKILQTIKTLKQIIQLSADYSQRQKRLAVDRQTLQKGKNELTEKKYSSKHSCWSSGKVC